MSQGLPRVSAFPPPVSLQSHDLTIDLYHAPREEERAVRVWENTV